MIGGQRVFLGAEGGKKRVMKKALNAILLVAAAWAPNTGTHSFREAQGTPANMNPSLWTSKHKQPFSDTRQTSDVTKISETNAHPSVSLQ